MIDSIDFSSNLKSIKDDPSFNMDAIYRYMVNCGAGYEDAASRFWTKYRLGEKQYDRLCDIPKIDIHEWAKEQGLKISEDGKTLTCYKAVRKTKDGKYKPCVQSNSSLEYKIGEYAFSDELDYDRFEECRAGLHAGNMTCAMNYANVGGWNDRVILELKVDISDPNNYVIPYKLTNVDRRDCEVIASNQFRFKSCYVVREVPCKRVWYNPETGEMWEIPKQIIIGAVMVT